MSKIPIAYWTIIDPLIAVARDILEQGEELVPIAFVGDLTTGLTHPVLMSTTSDRAKDYSAYLIRHFAEIHHADFVFLITEAWGLSRDKMGRIGEILERYGSVGASPYRIDLATFSLKTRHGLWVAQATVKPKGVSKKKRTFGEPEFQHFTEVKGRFVDLLPVKEPDGDASGVLH
jgi:hypothetical protein